MTTKNSKPIPELGNCIMCEKPIMMHFKDNKDEQGKSELYDRAVVTVHIKCSSGRPFQEIIEQSMEMYDLVKYIHEQLSDKKEYRILALHEQNYYDEASKIIKAIKTKVEQKNKG